MRPSWSGAFRVLRRWEIIRLSKQQSTMQSPKRRLSEGEVLQCMPPKALTLHHRSPGRGHIRNSNSPYDPIYANGSLLGPRSYISDPIGPLTALSHPWAIETHGARKASNPRFFCILVQGCSNEAPQLLQSIKHICALTSCMQRVYVIGLWNPCPCFILFWWRSHQNIPAHLSSA